MKENLADKLFFSREAADYLNITTQRLNALVKEEKLRPLKKSPSGTIFHIDELNKRIKEKKSNVFFQKLVKEVKMVCLNSIQK